MTQRMFTTYARVENGRLVSTSSMQAMLQGLGHLPKINPLGLSHLLHHSATPYPLSIYQGIYTIGLGDVPTLSADGTLTLTNTMPYLPEHSRGDQVPSPARLLELLSTSLVTKLADDDALLMLSSGKDSVALALAARHAGLTGRIHAATYAEKGEHSEADLAGQIARKFGLSHSVIDIPADTPTVARYLRAFFENSAQPVLDPVAPAYILALATAGQATGQGAGSSTTALLDGTGNDYYFGILPPPNKHYVHALTVGRFALGRALNALVSFHHPLAKYLRPQTDHVVLGRLALRYNETRRFYPGARPTGAPWLAIARDERLKPDYMHFFNHVRGYLYDGAHTTRAREELAHAHNRRLVMPWDDAALADYCFHLPVTAKYDLAKTRNKLLVRAMLKEFADYDADAVGKRIFEFNQPRFLLAHRTLVEEEILACTLWDQPAVEKFVKHTYALLPANGHARYPLTQLLMISGWHNHSRYLR